MFRVVSPAGEGRVRAGVWHLTVLVSRDPRIVSLGHWKVPVTVFLMNGQLEELPVLEEWCMSSTKGRPLDAGGTLPTHRTLRRRSCGIRLQG